MACQDNQPSRTADRATTVLVVEDDLDVAEALLELLARAGYCTRHAHSGEMALRLAAEARPDVVLLDLGLPDIDGLDLCSRLRSDARWNVVTIIGLTARSRLADRVAGLQRGLDDYVTKPFRSVELLARIEASLRHSHRERDTSPLTLLPGNAAIERALVQGLESGVDFAVCYFDIDRFKSYNDRYGFNAGDRVIRAVAEIGQLTLAEGSGGFLGHIGGDDFVAVIRPEEAERFCSALLARFEAVVRASYSREDLERGSIEVVDRGGVLRMSPLLGLSVAVVVQSDRRYGHIGELGRAAAEIKAYLKQHGGGFLIDRRRGQGSLAGEAARSGLAAIAEPQRASGSPMRDSTALQASASV
jgi:diguanylate cyclase (GGDEF)-like protein